MSSSFISNSYGDGVWIHDSVFQVFCHFLSSELDSHNPLKDDEWYQDFRHLVKENGVGSFPSYMHLNLTEIEKRNERVLFLIAILDSLKKKFRELGNEINEPLIFAILSSSGEDFVWSGSLETRALEEIADSLINLIRKGPKEN